MSTTVNGNTVTRTCDACDRSEKSPFTTAWFHVTSNASGEHKAQDLCSHECVAHSHAREAVLARQAVSDRKAAAEEAARTEVAYQAARPVDPNVEPL